MFEIKSLELRINSLTKKDIRYLFQWRNRMSFIQNCSSRKKVKTQKEFKIEIERDFLIDRFLQGLITLNSHPIGTIYSYSFNPVDLFCFVTTFLDEESVNRGLGLKAFILFCKLHFDNYKLHKIYADVYEYNTSSLNLFKKLKVSQEGKFKDQKFLNGNRFDVYRFAIYKEDIESSLRFIRNDFEMISKI